MRFVYRTVLWHLVGYVPVVGLTTTHRLPCEPSAFLERVCLLAKQVSPELWEGLFVRVGLTMVIHAMLGNISCQVGGYWRRAERSQEHLEGTEITARFYTELAVKPPSFREVWPSFSQNDLFSDGCPNCSFCIHC